MIKTFSASSINAFFSLSIDELALAQIKELKNYFIFIWNGAPELQKIRVDDQIIDLKQHHILCLTYANKIEFLNTDKIGLKTLLFNKEFYCIHTYDSEVSCNGLLFFGSEFIPILHLDRDETQRLETLVNVLKDEFDTKDNSQEEMLRILLKRFIIRCNRLAKKQLIPWLKKESEIDIYRKFNYLVEEHFKTKRKVSDYAALLFKSPKTLTNIFHLNFQKSPLQIIHDRLTLEAKRYLLYTDLSAKEISIELGFSDPTQFGKFFKKQVQLSPNEFKSSHQEMLIRE